GRRGQSVHGNGVRSGWPPVDRLWSLWRAGIVSNRSRRRHSLQADWANYRRRLAERDSAAGETIESMKHLVLIILAVFCAGGALVAKEAQSNEDPKIEQRMKALTEQLRCLVC